MFPRKSIRSVRAPRQKLGRQHKLEPRSIVPLRGRGQLTAMTLNNHAANRETQPYAMRLCREKRIKDAAQLLRIYSRPRIFDRDHYCIASVEPRCHPEHPVSIRGIHCLNRVLNQIRDDLLQLSPVAGNKWQL